MNLPLFLKNNFDSLPYSLGSLFSYVPYSYRPGIGKTYIQQKKNIKKYESFTAEEQQKYIYDLIYQLCIHSYSNVPFYKKFYDENKFDPKTELKNFDDIIKIPIIRKKDLQEYNIEERSTTVKNRYIVNTGGTSGNPLSFYIQPELMGNEWVHMHKIWAKLGFKQSDLKLGFTGRSDIGRGIKYDAVRHTFNLDIYNDYQDILSELKILFKNKKIKYLHGYPSAIYEFANFLEKNEDLLKLLKMKLKGVFLGSEFPHNHFRNKIEDVLKTETVSWYGHTERCVLAYERNKKFEYFPFKTYGHTEAIKIQKEKYSLISTSYHNYASPLIRYNTEDIIETPTWKNKILESFQINEGRSGEFIIDKNGLKIPLTGLIFGRHHKLFDYSKYIQIEQSECGKATILFQSSQINEKQAAKYFDESNVNIDFSYQRVEKPIKTKSGKIQLLLNGKQ